MTTRTVLKAIATSSVVWLVVGLASACSDDDKSSSSSSGFVPDGSASTTEASTGVDAATITPRPDLCQGLKRETDPVQELELLGDAPAPLGGTIAPGTYDLAELTAYGYVRDADAGDEAPSSRLTGKAAQITLIVTKFEMRRIEARGAANSDTATWPEKTSAVLYRTTGTDILGTGVCPETSLPAPTAYSAVGTGLALFVDKTHRELFVLRQ